MDEPKIAERVKFWQEQDRMNRELIPRVIRNHELLAKHIESHEDGDPLARAQIVTLEARAAELETLSAMSLAQIEGLEGRVAQLEKNVAKGLLRWTPYASLVVALVALGLGACGVADDHAVPITTLRVAKTASG